MGNNKPSQCPPLSSFTDLKAGRPQDGLPLDPLFAATHTEAGGKQLPSFVTGVVFR